TGMLKMAFSIPLSSVKEISFNDTSGSARLKYINEKGKEKKLNIGIGNKELCNQFGNYLGSKLGFTKTVATENKIKPLLLNTFLLLFTIGMTYFLATIRDTAELVETGSGSTRRKAEFLKLIVDTIGQTGVII